MFICSTPLFVVYVWTVQQPCYCRSLPLWTSHELFGAGGDIFLRPHLLTVRQVSPMLHVALPVYVD